MAEEASNEHTPPAFSFTDEASPSTKLYNTQGASSHLGAYTTISDDAWRYRWNTRHIPITDGNHNVDGATYNASTSFPLLGPSSTVDYGRPSTSHAGMEQATAILEDGARFPETTSVGQWNTQYHTVDGTSSISGNKENTEDGSTGFTLLSCSSGGDDSAASTSRAVMQEATGTLGNEARNSTATRGRRQEELCGISDNASTRPVALHGHVNQHTGDAAHISKATDHSPAKNLKFVEHCRTRTAENHNCGSCGKLFHRAYHLVRHYRTHTDERPYKCEICDKLFRRSDDLNSHKRIHTGEKPYRCHICDKSFRCSSSVDNHMRTHTGEKPYTCVTCGKSSRKCRIFVHTSSLTLTRSAISVISVVKHSEPSSLARHLKSHSKDAAFVCEICHLSFVNYSGIGHHRQVMHGDETLAESFGFADKENLDGYLCQKNTCYLCGDSFEEEVRLITHLVTHRDEQP